MDILTQEVILVKLRLLAKSGTRNVYSKKGRTERRKRRPKKINNLRLQREAYHNVLINYFPRHLTVSK